MTEATDLTTLLHDDEADIAAKVQFLDADHLKILRGLEADGQNRADLIAAIDREIAAREDAMRTIEHPAAGQVKTYSQAEVDQIVADLNEAHQARIKGMEESHRAAVDKLKAANAKAAAPVRKRGKPLAIDPKADATGLSALTGATQIQFVDVDMLPLDGLPPLDFGPDQFAPAGADAILTVPVHFPREAPRGEVMAGVLIADGKAVAVAPLTVPFAVCGGQSAMIPAGSLRFGRG